MERGWGMQMGGWVCFRAHWPYVTAAFFSQAEHTSPTSDKTQILEDWTLQALSESPVLKSVFYQLKFSTPWSYWALRLGLFPLQCITVPDGSWPYCFSEQLRMESFPEQW